MTDTATATELLEKILQNTEPKTSTQIVVSDNSTKIKTTFYPPLELDKTRKYEMALVNLETYHSFPNIDSSNNIFRYSPGSSQQRQWVDIRIPEGSYDLIDIAETIKISMKRNGHDDKAVKITANTNTLKTSWKFQTSLSLISECKDQLQVFSVLQKEFTKEGLHESQNVVNILSINSILVNVDVIGGSYVNGKTQNTIYSFFPNVSPGCKIVENPKNLAYLPVILDKISKMETVVTDQNGKQLNLRGENLPLERNIIA